MTNYNPKIIINTVVHEDKKFKVVRDDYLLGGTKQRGIIEFCERQKYDEFVYAGPSTGHAQIALAIGAKASGKRATIFLAKTKPMTLQTRLARKLGANIVETKYRMPLKELKQAAEDYVGAAAVATAAKSKKDIVPPKPMLLKLGFDDHDFCDALTRGIISALDDKLQQDGTYNFWLVGGSGLLATILHKIFYNSVFNVVQVGKEIDEIICGERFKLYKAPEFFYDKTMDPPPWDSVQTYDAKVWQFAKKYAKGDGTDIIWNVARDPTMADIYNN